MASDARTQVDPVRGFQPGFTYALDDIESINMSTGTLGFTIPLASLPPGPGPSGQLSLIYSSRYWTTEVGQNEAKPEFPTYRLGKNFESGGWTFNFGYQLSLLQDHADICGSNDGPNYVHLKVILPDGSAHTMYRSDVNSACPGVQIPTANFTIGTSETTNWYSIDGSYLRLTVPGTTNGANWPAEDWRLFLRNGTTVSFSGSGIQTVTDTNGNSIKYIRTSQPNTGLSRRILQDRFGRSIIIDHQLANGNTPDRDVITAPGFNDSLTWYVNWGTATPSLTQYVTTASPKATGILNGLNVVRDIILPNNLFYHFDYAARCAEVSRVTFPTGATVDYVYKIDSMAASVDVWWYDILANSLTSKTLAHSDLEDGNTVTQTKLWSFDFNGLTSKVTAPDQGVTTNYFNVVDYRSGASGAYSGFIYQTSHPDGSVSGTTWSENKPYSYITLDDVAYNPWISQTSEFLPSGNTPGKIRFSTRRQDKNGNITQIKEYDWQNYSPTAVPLTVLRQTDKTYYNATGDSSDTADVGNSYHKASSPSLLSLIKTETIQSPAGTTRYSQFAYDGLTISGSPTLGNPTEEWRWDSGKAAAVPTTAMTTANAIHTLRSFDSRGNVVSTTDARGIVTRFTFGAFTGCSAAGLFDDTCSDLYITKKTEADGAPEKRQTTFDYDLQTGVATSETDVDNGVTRLMGYDRYGRMTRVREASLRETNIQYDDTNRCVLTQRDLNSLGDRKLAVIRHYDALGRIRLEQSLETSGSEASCSDETAGIKTQYRYREAAGGAWQWKSNPYRAATSGGATGEETMGWTKSTFDKVKRILRVESTAGPDPAAGSSMGAVSYSYDTNTSTVTDQAGKSRSYTRDGLGRLQQVDDATGSTAYRYTASDDLTGVTQAAQTRTFKYDSLGRLIAATNPENYSTASPGLTCGSLIGAFSSCYYYDDNGNLTKKFDNRGQGLAYVYDALNRVLSKSNINVPNTINQTAVLYGYDNASVPNSRGRLTSVATQLNETSVTDYTAYDALGRVVSSGQTTGGQTYNLGYSYNLAGALTSERYPSGRVVRTCYDGANRVTQVGGSACGNSAGAYASSFQYAAHGEATKYVMGNNVSQEPAYNSRLQMSGMTVSNQNTNSQMWKAVWNWGTTQNNGNLQSATYVNGGVTFNQSFSYDGVNRLRTASENGGWNRTFDYDAVGNMTPSGNPAAPTVSFDEHNQIIGQTYDQMGNQQTVNGNRLTYDFEERIESITEGVSQAVERYVYDGDGRRVEKNGPNGAKTVFVYDALGQMVAEYSTAAASAGQGVWYLSPDYLGTARVITDGSGNLVGRHDYLPFGEEVDGGTFGRDGHWGAANDSVRQKFTGKERDSESGLDYFGARYYGSALGRMTSPDPHSGSLLHLINPQRWNMYAYGLNNPLFYTDPDGRDAIAVNLSKQVPLMGHMGVIVVTKDGTATYSREGPQTGGQFAGTNSVTNYSMPQVSFTDKGVPTDDSYRALGDAVAKAEGQDPSTVNFAYFKTSETDTQLALIYILEKAKKSQQGKLFPYVATGNNCADYCIHVLERAHAADLGSPIPNLLFWQLSFGADSVSQGSDRKKKPKEEVKSQICFYDEHGQKQCP